MRFFCNDRCDESRNSRIRNCACDQEFSERGLTPEKIVGKHKVVIGLVGETAALNPLQIQEISPL